MSIRNILTPQFKRTPKKKLLDFFLTEDGRMVTKSVMTTAALSPLFLLFGPDTYLVDWSVEYLQKMNLKGYPTEVNEKLKKLIDECRQKIKIKEPFVKSFVARGADLNVFGTSKAIYGAWIGVPVNYILEENDKLDRNSYILGAKTIDWNSEAGQKLERSLKLSEDEKKFAIFNALILSNSTKHIWDTFLGTISIALAYSAAGKLNVKYDLFVKPRILRCGIYVGLTTTSFFIYGLIKESFQMYRERKVDKDIVALGEDVIRAGISFYGKNLDKNIALNELSGKQLYKDNGNELHYFSLRRTELTKRKSFLESKLEELTKSVQ